MRTPSILLLFYFSLLVEKIRRRSSWQIVYWDFPKSQICGENTEYNVDSGHSLGDCRRMAGLPSMGARFASGLK
jgi:hypothetical protein